MIKMLTVTDTGLRRQTNQDCLACSQGEPVWAVVCDGMGGHAAGNIAADAACGALANALQHGLRQDMPARSVALLLETAVENANLAIYGQAAANPDLAGMGTTVVAAAVLQNTLYLCHAGDSRAYLVRGSECLLLTKDHSMVQHLIDQGEITPRQAQNHPDRHLITKAVGVEPCKVAPDFNVYDLRSGDMVLLCTDGLHGLVPHRELAGLCVQAVQAGSAQVLAQRANELGGSDNISAVLLYGIE